MGDDFSPRRKYEVGRIRTYVPHHSGEHIRALVLRRHIAIRTRVAGHRWQLGSYCNAAGCTGVSVCPCQGAPCYVGKQLPICAYVGSSGDGGNQGWPSAVSAITSRLRIQSQRRPLPSNTSASASTPQRPCKPSSPPQRMHPTGRGSRGLPCIRLSASRHAGALSSANVDRRLQGEIDLLARSLEVIAHARVRRKH